MEPIPQNKLSVYFDGLCHLCSREIEHYKKVPGNENLKFIDITNPQFDCVLEGLNPIDVHQYMHVKDTKGEIFIKVDAFIEIWKRLPRYRFAVRIAQMKIVRPFMNIGYWCFATIRPYLPKKKQACSDSPYCEIK